MLRVKAGWCRHFVSYGGDAYFKDWHAERKNSTGLLLQKGAHDIDILHWLCGGFSKRVTALGGLTLYDRAPGRRWRNYTIIGTRGRLSRRPDSTRPSRSRT